MNTLTEPLTAWSFDTEDETALKRYVDQSSIFAAECREHPGEQAALKACGATRHIWDTVEGIAQGDAPIVPQLLQTAIEGIELCIQAVSRMPMPADTPADVRGHLHQMTTAMTERRDDLTVLLNEGKMAFISRLEENLLGTE